MPGDGREEVTMGRQFYAYDLLTFAMKERGYTGLVSDESCACVIGDLCQCGCDPLSCQLGWRWDCDGCPRDECDVEDGRRPGGWCVRTEKPPKEVSSD